MELTKLRSDKGSHDTAFPCIALAFVFISIVAKAKGVPSFMSCDEGRWKAIVIDQGTASCSSAHGVNGSVPCWTKIIPGKN